MVANKIDENEEIKVIKEPVYTKERLLASKKYKHKQDVLNVVLKDGQSYSLKKVEDLIKNFMNTKAQVK